MPTIEVTTPQRRPLPLPPVCVKTGEPTQDRVRLRGSAAPGWVLVTLLFGVIPYFFVHGMTAQRYELVVPLRDEVLRARRTWPWVGAGVAVAGLVLGFAVAAATGSTGGEWLLLLVPMGLAVLVASEWRYAVGVRLTPDGAFELTRVHPRFRDAAVAATAAVQP